MRLLGRTLTTAILLLLLLSPALWSAKKRKPVTAGSQVEFGVDMARRGLWSEALFRFQQAERLGGAPTTIYNNMAVAYEALGVFEKAREYYQKALEADPQNTALRRNYSRFIEFYQSFRPEGEEDGESGDEDGGEAAGEDTGTP